jgi:hypothetical protein
MRLHEALLLPEIQEGRRLLYQVDAVEQVPSHDTIEYQKINRSLALFDTLGYYVQRRHVDRREVLELWHHSLLDLKEPAELFVQARRSKHRSEWMPWPRLRWLLVEGAAYRSKADCCKPVTSEGQR